MNIKNSDKVVLVIILAMFFTTKTFPKKHGGHVWHNFSGSNPKYRGHDHTLLESMSRHFGGMNPKVLSPSDITKNLFDAILKKDHEKIKTLIKLGANPNAKYPGSEITAIEFAKSLDDQFAVNILNHSQAG